MSNEYSRLYPSFSQDRIPTQKLANIRPRYKDSVEFGRQLRDQWVHEYAILPGAMKTFVDITASREWMILGKPGAAGKALDRLNNSFFVDSYGIRHKGWEQLVSRMCYDWLTIGRSMFHSKPLSDNMREWSAFEYIDPAYTYPRWGKVKELLPMEDGTFRETQTDIATWIYNPKNYYRGQREFFQEHIFFLDDIRIGQSGAILGRAAYLIPIANLDWLIRQHDTFRLDGRKITDVLVTTTDVAESLEDALMKFFTLAEGNDPSKNGIPLVTIDPDVNTDQTNLANFFTRLGISEIPTDFSRDELVMRYVREISGTLGISMGNFWQDNSLANRSLEQVQAERATQKGPSFFIRSLARLINTSPMMGRTPAQRAILQVEEETDNASMELKAKSFKTTVEAALGMNELLTSSAMNENGLGPDEWMGFMQRLGYMQPNMTMADIVVMEENSLKRSADEVMKKGMVRMDMNGQIIERRPDYQIDVRRKHDTSQFT